MIESCNTKRMVIGIALLGGLTVIVLIVESHWASGSGIGLANNASEECWHREKFEVIEPCHPCTDFEIASNSPAVCSETKFKEVLKCEVAGKVLRSCEKVTWIEERHYWIFEAVMFVIAVLSGCAVFIRQRILDRRFKNRIQRQLATGLTN